ncbi:ABC transporter permease [Candidatus Bathyarchaeota archaeon]|nr:ABC transporter permease [Candidatus Bathyarchaeota archaeon]
MTSSIKILRFKYLKRQRLLTLALIITAASLLFSITALSLLGFYKGFTAYLGGEGGEDIIAVYNSKSRTPYTGSVPAYLAYRLASVKGVVATSPEVMAPCLINDQAAFLRGIVPESFTKLNPLKIVRGSMFNLSDFGSAMVGERIAKRLGLNLNDRLLLIGVLADRYMELWVKGIFASNSIMDDEVLAPLHVGQWLRGMDYGSITIIRLKVDRSTVSLSEVFEKVASEAAQPIQPIPGQGKSAAQEPVMPWTIRRFSIEDIGVEEASKYMKGYMERYGVTREALVTLSAAVFLFSSSTIVIALKTVLSQHKDELSLLRALGASKRLLKVDMLIKLLPWTFTASAAGFLIASAILGVIQGLGYMQVLSHTVPFWLDPSIAALNFILAFTLVSVSVLGSGIE